MEQSEEDDDITADPENFIEVPKRVQGSAKKSAESISRYLEVSPVSYEFRWQSTFMA